MILTTTSNVRIDYPALSPVCTLTVVGSVPAKQDYNLDTGDYTPDYTLTPLTLQPLVTLAEGGGGNANARLSSVLWKANGEAVTSATAGFDTSGCSEGSATTGRLVVSKNIAVGERLALEFTATLYDANRGESHAIRAALTVKCISSGTMPRMTVDCPGALLYNPLRSGDRQVISALLMVGSKPCPAANRIYVWEVWDATLATPGWREIDPDGNPLDFWASHPGGDQSKLAVDQSLYGYGKRLRVRAKYDSGGQPAAAALDEASPCREMTLSRSLKNLRAEMFIPNGIAPGTASVRAEAVIMDKGGTVDAAKADKTLRVTWKTKPAGSGSFATAAVGRLAQVPTTAIAGQAGMTAQMVVEDLGPLLPWADNGMLLTDGDGKILLIK